MTIAIQFKCMKCGKIITSELTKDDVVITPIEKYGEVEDYDMDIYKECPNCGIQVIPLK